jgi:hypothetical protein
MWTTLLSITPTAVDRLEAWVARPVVKCLRTVGIRAALSHVRAVAEQLPLTDRWKTFLDYVVAKITRPLPPWLPPDRLALAG